MEESKKGVFEAVKDILDDRAEGLRDKTLVDGYETICGVKGNKLSGGQK